MTHETPSGAAETAVLSIDGLSKTYAGGFTALKSVDLDIRKGEIFALLGPNGAGKTTLIGIVCGLVNATAGRVEVFGHDIDGDYRKTRARIGLVPQEMSIDMFTKVKDAVAYSRGLFGKPADPGYIEQVLRDLSLWDKRDTQMRALSGGMKRRVMIAKALSHDPDILFLDEPTAGVDVELRQGMWQVVEKLRQRGKTIILTTHYIQEAEEMADRVGGDPPGRDRSGRGDRQADGQAGPQTAHPAAGRAADSSAAGADRRGAVALAGWRCPAFRL